MSFVNAISWFEIPSTDLDRAQKFYETIFDLELIVMDMPQMKMRMFPLDDISPEYGFMAVFIDTEGNRIGLHSVPQQ